MDTASHYVSFSLDDRIACHWLVLRFIDPDAQFLSLPTPEVLFEAVRIGVLAYDIHGAPFSHDGELCRFARAPQ